VNIEGKKVKLGPSGATTYDPVLAGELKDKYRGDPNVMVIEKPYVQLNPIHKTHFTVPPLPWKKDE